MEWATASLKIDQFLRVFLEASGMEMTYTLAEGLEGERPRLRVEFSGPEARSLVARNAELLLAMESLSAGILRLEPDEHDLISFDAESYKAGRAERVGRAAGVAVASVTASGRPYAFPPMNSRERRMLHLELASSGLRSVSSGEAARRYVVLYPAEVAMPGEEETGATRAGDDRAGADRAKVIRSAFRPR